MKEEKRNSFAVVSPPIFCLSFYMFDFITYSHLCIFIVVKCQNGDKVPE